MPFASFISRRTVSAESKIGSVAQATGLGRATAAAVHVDHPVLQIDVGPVQVQRLIQAHAGAGQDGDEVADVAVAFAEELLHLAPGLEPEKRMLGDREQLDELGRVVAAPALLDEVVERRRSVAKTPLTVLGANGTSRSRRSLRSSSSFDFVTFTTGVLSSSGRTYRRMRSEYSSCERWSLIARSHASNASPSVRVWSRAGGRSPARIPRCVTRCCWSACSASRFEATEPT